MIENDANKSVSCQISKFQELSNFNGLSLLDSTYLERLITFLLKNEKYACFEGIVDLKELTQVFAKKSIRGVQVALERLSNSGALIIYKKAGKYHKNKYIISVDKKYTKYFYQES